MTLPPEPSTTAYFSAAGIGERYEVHSYTGVSGWVLRTSHGLVEREFAATDSFARVLEVGAGAGAHFAHVRHGYQEYVMTDGSSVMLDAARRKILQNTGVRFEIQDAAHLAYADQSFDRLIAAHTLEHISSPHLVVDEWWRVLKDGGVLSAVLPCDPGVMWRLGRSLGPRAKAEKAGLSYDYVMALEHVNSIMGLRAILREKFKDCRKREYWWPFPFPSVDLNLIYAVNIWK